MLKAGMNVHRALLSTLASAALQLSQGPEQGDRLDIHVKELDESIHFVSLYLPHPAPWCS